MAERECVHLVIDSYFWSRNKEGGHANRSAVEKNGTLHAHFTALCIIDAELSAMAFSHCGEADLW